MHVVISCIRRHFKLLNAWFNQQKDRQLPLRLQYLEASVIHYSAMLGKVVKMDCFFAVSVCCVVLLELDKGPVFGSKRRDLESV